MLVHEVMAAISTSPEPMLDARRQGDALVQCSGLSSEPARVDGGRKKAREFAADLADLDPVLRSFRTGQRRRDGREVEDQHLGIVDLAGTGHAEQFLRPVIGLEQRHLVGTSAGGCQVGHRLRVDRKVPQGCPVLGRHVGDRRPVRNRQARRTFPEELDELADDARLAQQLGQGQDEVGRRDAGAQFSPQFDSDHVGGQQIHGLAEHRRLRFDAADAPADDTDAIDHRRMAVGADQRIRKRHAVADHHAARQILEIDLMHDAGARRYDAEGLEGRHAPLQELVALAIALEFELHVEVERVGSAIVVDGDRVVDDQIDRHLRLDARRIVAQGGRRIAHRRQIGKQGHAGEVLQHHAGDDKGNLVQALGVWAPCGELPDVIVGHPVAVAVAQHRLEHDAQGAGQAGHVRKTAGEDRQRFDEISAGHAGKRNPAVGQVMHGNTPGSQGRESTGWHLDWPQGGSVPLSPEPARSWWH